MGNYSVSFTAFLFNEETSYAPLIPVFLVRNNVFDPATSAEVGSVGILFSGRITPIQITGILENVEAGTLLSLVATNGGSPQPEPVIVVEWEIFVFRIAESKDDSHHKRCFF